MECVRPGLKQDTWTMVRHAPLFATGLFSDDALVIAEQDILKHEAIADVQGPGLGTYQHPAKKSNFHFKSYDKKDSKQSGYALQPQQTWRQF